MVGKWGLGEPDTTGVPNRQGFDYWFGYLNQRSAHSYYPEHLWRNEEKYPLEGNRDGGRKQYSHDLFTREVLGFLERSKDKPFFLYIPFTIPHGTHEIPSDAPYSDRSWPQKLKNFAAMVTLMDRDIGRIMQKVKDLGLDEKTLVFFCSDNGPAFVEEIFDSNGPLRGMKGDLYEGGIRVPMIARWANTVPAGRTSDHVWAHWDLFPTLADLAGAKTPANVDGLSMRRALVGQPQPTHEYLYWEFHERGFQQAVRSGPWKAVRLKRGAPFELYNLDADPAEQTNVADSNPAVVTRLETYLSTARTDSPIWPLK
jgi:arylsulfatase A-like enzyme